jgi:hydrogenase maturation protein HypF
MPERVARFITISGRVQGVGFRPFVYRLAHQHGISGWVRNVSGAVEIHAEGELPQLLRFSDALIEQAPPLSAPGPLAIAPCATAAAEGFSILDSAASSHADIHLPPDGFVCADCLAESRSPARCAGRICNSSPARKAIRGMRRRWPPLSLLCATEKSSR